MARAAPDSARVFLFDLNLPRIAAALVAGGCLGIAGALFQSATRNPLASPDLLGVTGGAQLGLLAAMIVPALAGVPSVPLLFACGLAAAACARVAAPRGPAYCMRAPSARRPAARRASSAGSTACPGRVAPRCSRWRARSCWSWARRPAPNG
ncbi:hypothetical protein WT15_11075 [Burkholderia stagnalis]|nr:hypothetical protein WT74_05115 [Burkholderia stagnalis]KVN80670.1 hypothetical protein WT15_11075 [Burkholderia stagnalis]KWO25444.1 hypothetical protein WT96_33420 [Burkholderia stagnalis]KWO42141.1 hypothetical protein WT95_33540 [Burkholderia stagnalis]